MRRRVRPAAGIAGRLRVPGDKSISHRYAMLAAMADGVSRIQGYLTGADCLATLGCLRAPRRRHSSRTPGGLIDSQGPRLGGLRRPTGPLDAANSGTSMRLLAGHRRGAPVPHGARRRRLAVAPADAPRHRAADPRWGRRSASQDGRPPLTIDGTRLHGITLSPRSPERAGEERRAARRAPGDGRDHVIEPVATRDHTERALQAFGVDVPTTNGARSASPAVSGSRAQRPRRTRRRLERRVLDRARRGDARRGDRDRGRRPEPHPHGGLRRRAPRRGADRRRRPATNDGAGEPDRAHSRRATASPASFEIAAGGSPRADRRDPGARRARRDAAGRAAEMTRARRRRAAREGKRPHHVPGGGLRGHGRGGRGIPRRFRLSARPLTRRHRRRGGRSPARHGVRARGHARVGADDDRSAPHRSTSRTRDSSRRSSAHAVTADKIYLVGFMAAGKTTVARALADAARLARRGRRRADRSARAAARRRTSSRKAGEPYFRAVEREILQGPAAAAARRRRHRRRHVRRSRNRGGDQPRRPLGLARRADRRRPRAAPGGRPAAARRRSRQMERLFATRRAAYAHGAPATSTRQRPRDEVAERIVERDRG